MAFFSKICSPSIIGEYKKEELEQFLKENNIFLNIHDESSLWAAFANKYGQDNGLDPYEAASFSSIVTLFICDMACSAGTDAYYNEEAIEYKVLDFLKECDIEDEEEKARRLFFFVFNLYKEEMGDYELKNNQVGVRLTRKQYELFMGVPGASKTEKVLELLKFWDESH